MAARIIVIESDAQELTAAIRGTGVNVAATLPLTDLIGVDRQGAPDLLVLDLRGQTVVPPALGALKRRYAGMGVVIVAAALDPTMMLEAMRAGVNEFVTEPITPPNLRAAIDRVMGHHAGPAPLGQVLAFIGAKGGVGTTTLAVNVAAALADDRPGQVLMVDLHVAAHGDVALLLGVEPRFSVVDAIENTHRLDEAFLKSLVVRSKSGVDVLASPEHPLLRAPEGHQIKALLEQLATHYRVVVLDVPRADLGVVDALEPLSAIALVVNQELPTVRRAAQIATLLRQRYGKDKVAAVVSRYDARADIGQEDIERVVGLPVWAALPSDYRKVIAAANLGKPLVAENHSRLASSVRQLATRLAGKPPATEKPAKVARRGFF